MTADPYADLRARVLEAAGRGPGETAPALRAAAFAGRDLPADLAPLVETMRQHAYRVTDADVASLRSAHSDDALFEVIVNGALGAANQRLELGLRALDDA